MTQARSMVRILGIDPGSVITGYGIIDSDGRDNHHIAHGCLRLGTMPPPERLANIHRQLSALIAEWQPTAAAIEQVFMSRNPASALKLGQARGVAIAACILENVTVHEYAARTVKQAIVGTGAAAKQQVQHMTRVLLNLKQPIQADAADALALAICHGHQFRQTVIPIDRKRSGRRSWRLKS